MTIMDWLEIIGGIITAFGGILLTVLWFIVQGVLTQMAKLEESINQHKNHTIDTYAKKTELQDSFVRLYDSFNDVQKIVNGMAVNLATLTERISNKM